MNKKMLMIVGGVVVVLLVAGAASRFVGKSAVENAIEDATGGKVNIDGNGGDITVKTDEGTWSTSDKLPSDFPADVPVYPGSKVQASVAAAQQQGGGTYAGLETTDSTDKVAAWYKTEVVAKGWTISTNLEVDGGLMIGATKDTRELVITVSKDEAKTTIGLMVTKK